VRRRVLTQIVVSGIVAAVLALPVCAEQPGNGHWVSAWSTAVHTPLPFPGLPPSPVFENQTVRMVVRPTIGGQRLRIRFSNEFGTTALKIGAAHVALTAKGAAIVPDSDHALTFGGRPSVTAPPGAPVLSDPVDLKVAPCQKKQPLPQSISGRSTIPTFRNRVTSPRKQIYLTQPPKPRGTSLRTWKFGLRIKLVRP
jgi:hypothetical protein